jgi:hypothetical protein
MEGQIGFNTLLRRLARPALMVAKLLALDSCPARPLSKRLRLKWRDSLSEWLPFQRGQSLRRNHRDPISAELINDCKSANI